MATASYVASAALKRILVEADEAPLEASDYTDLYASMNNYMAALEAQGVRLGYTPVSGPADEITIPSGALRGLIANVALEVAPDYGGNVSADLVQQARDGIQVMRLLGQSIGGAMLPNTLPMGSGYESTDSSHFFTSQVQGRLSMAGNATATTFAAANTAVRVRGRWAIEAAYGFQGDISGAMANTTSLPITVSVDLSLTCTGNSTYTFRITQNGVSVANTAKAVTAAPTAVTLATSVTLQPGDFIEVFVENDTNTTAITVTDAQVVIS